MVSFKAYTEKCANVVNDLLAPDVNSFSVQAPLQRRKKVQMSIQMVEIRPNILVDCSSFRLGSCM